MREEEVLGLFGGIFGCGLVLGILVVVGIIWWKIFDKAGYGGPFGLLMLVPLANIVLLCILAFGKWPVLEELETLRRRQGNPRPPSL